MAEVDLSIVHCRSESETLNTHEHERHYAVQKMKQVIYQRV